MRIWIDFAHKSFLRLRQRNLNIRHPIRIKIHTCPKLNVYFLCQHNSASRFFIIRTDVGSFIAITSKVIVWNHKLSNFKKSMFRQNNAVILVKISDFLFAYLPSTHTHTFSFYVKCKTRTAVFYVMFKTRASVFYRDLKPRSTVEWFKTR